MARVVQGITYTPAVDTMEDRHSDLQDALSCDDHKAIQEITSKLAEGALKLSEITRQKSQTTQSDESCRESGCAPVRVWVAVLGKRPTPASEDSSGQEVGEIQSNSLQSRVGKHAVLIFVTFFV